MSDLFYLEKAIAALRRSDLAALCRWFSEFDFKAWDEQIETDASAGKLDTLLIEAGEYSQREPSTRVL